jgi:sugar phosphate isomerase/epimerase
MTRPITLFTGQWADLPLEEVARLASEWGYDGLEVACWGDHLDPWRWDDDAYVQGRLDLLDRYGLKVWAISNHLKGQAVCDDPIDERHRDILSDRVWGDGEPEGIRRRAAEEMQHTARLAAKLGVKTVVGFTGSSIWKYVAMFPPASQALVDAGYEDFAARWNPILDVFDEVGVRFAHEVHPSEIAYDYWTTVRTLEAIGHREAFGLNWDPSHFMWQDLDPVGFILEFADRIYHVDCKDVKLNVGNGRKRPARLAPRLGGPASRMGLRVDRSRRRAVGEELPRPECDRLRRTHLGRVGGRRDGSAGRRARGARVRAAQRVRRARGGVRRSVQHAVGASSGVAV